MSGALLLAGEDEFCTLPDGRRLCYRSFGAPTAPPLVLLVGLGLQLIYWPPQLVSGLVERGYRVIVLDNRDSGRSSLIDARPPTLYQQLFRIAPADAYDLADMAGDVVALMDRLQLPSAHLAGMSMGGMIAQTLAARWPQRVRSLASIFSSTGARAVGQPATSSLRLILRAPAPSREAAVAHHERISAHIGATRFEMNADAIRAYAGLAWERGHGAAAAAGIARQIGAIVKSGDRSAELRGVRTPTLVIHGDRDLMVHSSGGHATARAIPGARFVLIGGMGHAITADMSPLLVDLLAGHADRAPCITSIPQSALRAA